METMIQRVGAAILLAEAEWNPKTAKESKETVMARAAIEAMDIVTEATRSAGSWLERYGKHVGSCRGGDRCTCGLTAITAELDYALTTLGDKGEPTAVPSASDQQAL